MDGETNGHMQSINYHKELQSEMIHSYYHLRL